MSAMKNHNNKKITRKAAIKKMAKYTALTAVGTLIILNPQKAQAASTPPGDETGGNPFGI